MASKKFEALSSQIRAFSYIPFSSDEFMLRFNLDDDLFACYVLYELVSMGFLERLSDDSWVWNPDGPYKNTERYIYWEWTQKVQP